MPWKTVPGTNGSAELLGGWTNAEAERLERLTRLLEAKLSEPLVNDVRNPLTNASTTKPTTGWKQVDSPPVVVNDRSNGVLPQALEWDDGEALDDTSFFQEEPRCESIEADPTVRLADALTSLGRLVEQLTIMLSERRVGKAAASDDMLPPHSGNSTGVRLRIVHSDGTESVVIEE